MYNLLVIIIWKFQNSTWNIDTLLGKRCKVIKALIRRQVDVCCLQEIMWKTAQILDLLQEKMLYLRFSGEACIAVHQKWIENIL